MVGSVGFVPTMGYLHQGHLTLVRRARQENQRVVVSIFVNPMQFGPQEDLLHYPRDEERDRGLLEGEAVDVLFIPSVAEMYPAGYSTFVEVEEVTRRLEGASRPGHFRGVATVVAKLFNIVMPTRAYLGEKDAQQLLVVRRMVQDLNMDMAIVAVPTVREPDGLAMSSRNVYLSPEERRAATILWRALQLAQGLYSKGEKRGRSIRDQMVHLINSEPSAKVDYVNVADAETLEDLEEVKAPALASLAVWIGKTRLIDNIMLK